MKNASIRFWSKVNKTDNCWIWIGAGSRYGAFTIKRKNYLAHRFAYEDIIGPIPKDLTIDHLCRNTKCVNPKHSEPVSLAENNRRAAFIKVACPKGHLYNEENTYHYKNRRGCKECRRESTRKYRRSNQ